MKRHWLITLASLLLIGIAAIAYARSSGSSITVTPSEMKNGETKTFTDDGRTITLRRDGDTISAVEAAPRQVEPNGKHEDERIELHELRECEHDAGQDP